MNPKRWTAALVAAAIVLMPLAAGAAPGDECEGVATMGDWSGIQSPFTAPIRSYSVDPLDPDQIFVTDGTSLRVTGDGGCSWDSVLELTSFPTPDVPIIGPAATIKSIDIPEAPGATSNIYLLVEESVASTGAARVHVLRSQDDGSTWSLNDTGLPLVSGPAAHLAVAPSDPDVLYLFITTPALGGDDVYRSSNAGESWAMVSTDQAVTGGVAIDQLNPDEFWTWGVSGLRHSTDGGRTRPVVNSVASNVSMVDVFHGPQGPARVMAYEPETSTFSVTDDGGLNWYRIGGPRGFAISMTHAATANDVVVSVHEGAYRFEAPRFWIEITPMEIIESVGDVSALSADRTETPSIFGITPGGLVKYTGLNNAVDLSPFTPGTIEGFSGRPELSPRKAEVRIEPGASETISYRLSLPPRPTPLDVFFLVDTTQSMTSSINGLRAGMQGIIDELAATGIDVQFGIGEYKDYPTPGYGDPLANDFPYRRNRPIGPPDEALANGLEMLEATGGGDIPESQLTALYQAATGEGQAGFVPPGGEAGFRPGALPTIVHITDAPFHDSPAYPSPSFNQVAQELRSRGILQIGLAVFGPSGINGAVNYLGRMAGETGTVATAEGVDCNGDGHRDIAPGAAIVCEIRDERQRGVSSLVPAIIAALKAVSDEVPVELVSSARQVTDRITPDIYETVDLKDGSDLEFDVRFECPLELAGQTRDVTLDARTRGDIVATARATVRCLPLPAVEPVPPVILVAPLAPPLARPLLPPPPQVPHEIPVQQPNPQAQGAVVQQRQEQPQAAFVNASNHVQPQVAKDDEYAFMRRERDESAPMLAFASAAAMMSLAYVLALRTRHRTSFSFVRR
ncbi:MAG TPA: hypothetical protein VNC78_07300 [Actinomycetota bacterium]|nr:hypothetical protein [Actinomycetota bacterium]